MSFCGIFENKRVLVTGHTGFKGSWLCLWLAELGAEVYGYSLEAPTKPSLFEEAKVVERLVGHEVGDIRNAERLKNTLKKVRPSIVFHLAAQSLVRRSYAEPQETYETNVMGTVNLLEAIRACDSVKVCQIITSDKCYENWEWVYAYRENDPMGGSDPYSNSKGCAELVVSSYRRSFFPPERFEKHGVSLSSARAGNVIGGGDWSEDRIIPDSIRALTVGNPIEVRNPNAVRPWQHVLEPLSGYLWLAARQWSEPRRFSDGWNFGPMPAGHATVEEIVQEIVRQWGEGEYRPDSPSEAPHEAHLLKLDITKAADLLAWRPVYSLKEALSVTVDWYKAWAQGCARDELRVLTLNQIRAYTKAAREQSLSWAAEG
ncbi:CDP-glucose 4,6-dehydratase [Candidatus Parcubacteria bacterium]|nr:MAG: CDP-glucose 4,6-dehydratase [Candidatus Parcubacteria bacterium]